MNVMVQQGQGALYALVVHRNLEPFLRVQPHFVVIGGTRSARKDYARNSQPLTQINRTYIRGSKSSGYRLVVQNR